MQEKKWRKENILIFVTLIYVCGFIIPRIGPETLHFWYVFS